MAGRGRTSSQKRRKEQNRLEKRQSKAERKQQVKEKVPGEDGPEEDAIMLGPPPLEFDPELDRGITPDLGFEIEKDRPSQS